MLWLLEGGQSRVEDAEEFKHPGRVADRAGCSFAVLRLLYPLSYEATRIQN
jgi:hypothetical protein